MRYASIEKKEARELEVNTLCKMWHDCDSWPEFVMKASILGTLTKWRQFLFWTFLMKKEHAALYRASFIAYFTAAAIAVLFLPTALGLVAAGAILSSIIAYMSFVADFHTKLQKLSPYVSLYANVDFCSLYPTTIAASKVKATPMK